MIQTINDIFSEELKKISELIGRNLPFKINDYGKLIRSKIGILFLKAYNIDISDKYIKLLASIELIHNASLLHDDVIDSNNERRGIRTVNFLHGNKLSILYGDIVLSNALDLILGLSNFELTKLFNNTVKEMCEGEIIQNSHINIIPTMEQYIKKTELKTAKLFEFILKSISILSDNKVPIEEVDFGKNFGIAFQVKNDLENILTTKSDIKDGIYTAPVIYSGGLEIKESAIEKTFGLIDNYSMKAIKVLDLIEESIYKKELIRIVECLKK